MSRRLVGMMIASPGVQVDLEVNLKPNQDTEQGLSPTVTQEVGREAPHHLIDQEATLEVGAEDGTAEAEPEAGAVPTGVTKVIGRPAGADPGAAHMIPTVGPGPTPTIATIAGVGVEVEAREVTVTTEAEVIIGGPGVVDLMALTVKVTEVTLITGAPVRAADIVENVLFVDTNYILFVNIWQLKSLRNLMTVCCSISISEMNFKNRYFLIVTRSFTCGENLKYRYVS